MRRNRTTSRSSLALVLSELAALFLLVMEPARGNQSVPPAVSSGHSTVVATSVPSTISPKIVTV